MSEIVIQDRRREEILDPLLPIPLHLHLGLRQERVVLRLVDRLTALAPGRIEPAAVDVAAEPAAPLPCPKAAAHRVVIRAGRGRFGGWSNAS